MPVPVTMIVSTPDSRARATTSSRSVAKAACVRLAPISIKSGLSLFLQLLQAIEQRQRIARAQVVRIHLLQRLAQRIDGGLGLRGRGLQEQIVLPAARQALLLQHL